LLFATAPGIIKQLTGKSITKSTVRETTTKLSGMPILAITLLLKKILKQVYLIGFYYSGIKKRKSLTVFHNLFRIYHFERAASDDDWDQSAGTKREGMSRMLQEIGWSRSGLSRLQLADVWKTKMLG